MGGGSSVFYGSARSIGQRRLVHSHPTSHFICTTASRTLCPHSKYLKYMLTPSKRIARYNIALSFRRRAITNDRFIPLVFNSVSGSIFAKLRTLAGTPWGLVFDTFFVCFAAPQGVPRPGSHVGPWGGQWLPKATNSLPLTSCPSGIGFPRGSKVLRLRTKM